VLLIVSSCDVAWILVLYHCHCLYHTNYNVSVHLNVNETHVCNSLCYESFSHEPCNVTEFLALIIINDTIPERPHNGTTKVIIIIISIISPRAYRLIIITINYVSRSLVNYYNSLDNVMQRLCPEPPLSTVSVVQRRSPHYLIFAIGDHRADSTLYDCDYVLLVFLIADCALVFLVTSHRHPCQHTL